MLFLNTKLLLKLVKAELLLSGQVLAALPARLLRSCQTPTL